MDNYKIPRMETLKNTSELTGLSYSWLRSACLTNQIVHIRTGNKFYINIDKLAEYLNGGENVEQGK